MTNPVYQPYDVFISRRNATSSSFEEYVLSSGQNEVITFDSASNLVSIPKNILIIGTASYFSGSISNADYATIAGSSSYLNPGSNIYLSQSYIISTAGSTQPPFQPATLWWDDSAKTYAMYTDHDGVALQIGQENWIRAYAGENLPNGFAVYITGSIGLLPIVKLAIADGLLHTVASQVIGLATETISSGSIGIITTQGQVHDLDTSTFIPGQIIYLSNVGSGSFLVTPPPDPYQNVAVGYVIKSDATDGIIQVNVSNFGIENYPFVGITNIPTITTSSTSPTGSIFTIGTGSVNLCTNANGTGKVLNYQIPSASFSLTTDFINSQYVVATYNSGSPIYTIVDNKTDINEIQSTLVFTVLNGTNGQFVSSNWDAPGILLSNKDYKRVQCLRGVERESGCVLNVSGSTADNYITITNGYVWQGVNRQNLTAVNSATDRFVLVAHSASIWSGSLISASIYNQYDNGTNLVSLNNNNYVVNWIYRTNVSTNATLVLLSDSFDTLVNSVESQPPTLPVELNNYAFLTGRIILKNTPTATSRFQQVDSSYVKSFSPAGITNHNELNNLQGGTTNEYYHLTSASYSTLGISSSYSEQSLTCSYFNSSSATPISASLILSGYFLPIYVSGSIKYLPLYV